MGQLKEVPCRHVDCPALGAVAVLAQQNSFGYALVGGAVRDAYHSRAATDHDIAVWAWKVNDVVDIQFALEELGYVEELGNDVAPAYEGEARTGLYECVLQYSHNVHPSVDILVYNPEFGTLGDVLNAFDYNINQFAITLDDVDKSQRQTAYYGGDQLYQLRRLASPSITEERADRVYGIALAYGWKLPEVPACPQVPLAFP